MIYRWFGRTGLRISRFSLGAMAFGTEAPLDEARAMWRLARDRGINHVDTANVYGQGESERIVGSLLADCRNEMIVATKAYFPTADSPNARGSSRLHLRAAVEASLRRLGTDRIDIFYLHRADDATAPEETARALEWLVQQGMVLHIGCSNFSAWQVVQLAGLLDHRSHLACIQPMYNLVKRQAEVELLPMAIALGLGVINYSPTAGGLLTGKYGVTARPRAGRLVDNAMYGVRYGDAAYFETAESLNAAAATRTASPAHLALLWSNSHPAICSTLLGARNVSQLTSLLEVGDTLFDPDERESLGALSPTPPPATDRNEELSAHQYGLR